MNRETAIQFMDDLAEGVVKRGPRGDNKWGEVEVEAVVRLYDGELEAFIDE